MPAIAIPYAYKAIDWRQPAGGAAATLAVVSGLLFYDFISPWIAVQWASIAIAAWTLGFRKVDKSTAILLGLIVVSAWFAILGAHIANPKGLPTTVGAAVFILPMAFIYAIRVPSWVLWGVGAVGFFHALLIASGSDFGIVHNQNIAGGLLVVTAAILLHNRNTRPFALIAMMLIPFTDSRWAVASMVGVVAMYCWTGKLRGYGWAAIWIAGVIAILVFAMVAEPNIPLKDDILSRFGFVFGESKNGYIAYEFALPGFMGHGSIANIGLHNTATRIAFEWGIVASVAWLMVMWRSLVGRRMFTPAWFAMFALAVLSLLDYYVLFTMFPLWWLLVGMREQE